MRFVASKLLSVKNRLAILVAVRNHIQRIDSREVYQGNLVHLREDSVILPRGTPMTYEYVEIKNGSSTLAVEDNGDVWLVREWKYAIDRPSLEVVSGGLEPDEEPLEGARRELREEAGLTAAEWLPVGFVDPFTTMLRCPNHMFIARGLTRVASDPEEAEIIERVRMPLREAADLVMTGGITHGTSCVLILKAAVLLSR
jgi:8-oxo-dGTP pyrophosphatase MutT (NUDIX family)